MIAQSEENTGYRVHPNQGSLVELCTQVKQAFHLYRVSEILLDLSK